MTDQEKNIDAASEIQEITPAVEREILETTTKPASKAKRTAKDYKELYDYLHKKYTDKNNELNDHDELESKLLDLIKFYQLRNSSIIDLIHFIDEQEAKSIGYPMTSELSEKQEHHRVMKILSAKPELKPLLMPMLKDESTQWNIRPELNQCLYLLENLANTSIYSPSELETLFDEVNKNVLYTHSIVPNEKYVELKNMDCPSVSDYIASFKAGKNLKKRKAVKETKSTDKQEAGEADVEEYEEEEADELEDTMVREEDEGETNVKKIKIASVIDEETEDPSMTPTAEVVLSSQDVKEE